MEDTFDNQDIETQNKTNSDLDPEWHECPFEIKEERIERVAELLLLKTPRFKIVQKIGTEYRIKPRAVDKLIAIAKLRIKAPHNKNIEENTNQRLAELDELYRKCIELEQYAVARQILKDKTDIEGLIINKMDITSGGKTLPTSINIIKLNNDGTGD